jgi:hypothetical protein
MSDVVRWSMSSVYQQAMEIQVTIKVNQIKKVGNLLILSLGCKIYT